MEELNIEPPAPIGERHRVAEFNSGVESLDDWLRRRALANERNDASRTFVACQGDIVAGYYALASGSLGTETAVGRFRGNMPDPIPVSILARLAVDMRFRGRGLGRALFRDAGLRLLTAAPVMGIRGLIVHAISEEARAFYLALGLEPSSIQPMTLMTTLADLRKSLAGES